MSKQWLGICLSILIFSTSCFATLSFRIDILDPDNKIVIGETTTLQVSVYSDETVPDNGAASWVFSLLLNTDNVVEAVDTRIIKPENLFQSSNGVLNEGKRGQVYGMEALDAAFFQPDGKSQLGVGDYDVIAEIDVKGIGQGTAVYTLGPSPAYNGNPAGDFLGALMNGSSPLVEFDTTSDSEIKVIPEPATILLFSVGFAALGYMKKR